MIRYYDTSETFRELEKRFAGEAVRIVRTNDHYSACVFDDKEQSFDEGGYSAAHRRIRARNAMHRNRARRSS